MKTSHNIINGDSRYMVELNNESVDLIITSPPYWQLKDYGTQDQIGFLDSYENYINNLNLVWRESHRVLKSGCRLCINIGDQFARSTYYGRYKVIPIRTEIIKFCEIIGFDYMGSIIWQKVTSTNTSGGGVQMGSYPYPRNGVIKIDYEFILIFKKHGKQPKFTKEQKEKSKMTADEWNTYFSGHWNFPGIRQKSHIAMFPVELPLRLIKMFSFVGETILDPFAGSGTTALAARNLARNSVSYEINSQFIDIIKDKLEISKVNIYQCEYNFSVSPNIDQNFNDKIQNLPYIFKDSLLLDKKVDVMKTNYGNKIGIQSIKGENLYLVKEIISPVRVKMDTGQVFQLIGLKTIQEKVEDAIEFLKLKILGKRVFLKFDNSEVFIKNESVNQSCYLYLKNKTFINAHLLKNKLVDIDEEQDFDLKNRFRKYIN